MRLVSCPSAVHTGRAPRVLLRSRHRPRGEARAESDDGQRRPGVTVREGIGEGESIVEDEPEAGGWLLLDEREKSATVFDEGFGRDVRAGVPPAHRAPGVPLGHERAVADANRAARFGQLTVCEYHAYRETDCFFGQKRDNTRARPGLGTLR